MADSPSTALSCDDLCSPVCIRNRLRGVTGLARWLDEEDTVFTAASFSLRLEMLVVQEAEARAGGSIFWEYAEVEEVGGFRHSSSSLILRLLDRGNIKLNAWKIALYLEMLDGLLMEWLRSNEDALTLARSVWKNVIAANYLEKKYELHLQFCTIINILSIAFRDNFWLGLGVVYFIIIGKIPTWDAELT